MQKSVSSKLVLFDLDGTVVDTAPDFVLSLNNVLKRNGRAALQFDHVRSFVSEGSVKFTEIGFEITRDHPEFSKYRKEFLTEYKNNLTNQSKLFTGISALLNQLDEMEIPYGIVTNKPFDYAEPLINYFDELKNCRELICPDHLKNSKPSPEGILLACKKIGVDPKESVYVGDHPNDLIAGKNAGTKTIGCLYGYSLDKDEIYPESIMVNQADEIIKALRLL